MHLISIKHQQGFTPTPTLKKSNNNLPPKHNESRCGGFTLIELLVVIAIIGILASVVLASLNTARTKGQIASIKSNLKNIIPQAELAYDVLGNYSTVCTDTKVAGMLTAITNAGGTAACSNTIDTTRYGASAIIGISTPLQAYSVSSTGVTTWDTQGVNISGVFVSSDVGMTWNQANTACSTAGSRLPTMEELKTLTDASYIASGSTSRTPPGFVASYYWSNTISPTDLNYAYGVGMISGSVYTSGKTATGYVRCVR